MEPVCYQVEDESGYWYCESHGHWVADSAICASTAAPRRNTADFVLNMTVRPVRRLVERTAIEPLAHIERLVDAWVKRGAPRTVGISYPARRTGK